MGESALKVQSERAYWFVARGEELVGPLMSMQLLEQIRSRAIGPSDFCWKDGFSEWRPVASVSDFATECQGKTFAVVAYPKLAIPSQKSSENPKRRRLSDNMTMLSLAPENRKVVQVNFAKTRIRRLSLYEWAFAMIFTIVCTYMGSKLTLDAVIARMNQIRQQKHVAGRTQHMGSVDSDTYVFADYAAMPLLSAPAWTSIDYRISSSGQEGLFHRPVMSFTAYKDGARVAHPQWPLSAQASARAWNPERHDLDTVYHRPVRATTYVPYTNSSHVNLVLRGEPYLY